MCINIFFYGTEQFLLFKTIMIILFSVLLSILLIIFKLVYQNQRKNIRHSKLLTFANL